MIWHPGPSKYACERMFTCNRSWQLTNNTPIVEKCRRDRRGTCTVETECARRQTFEMGYTITIVQIHNNNSIPLINLSTPIVDPVLPLTPIVNPFVPMTPIVKPFIPLALITNSLLLLAPIANSRLPLTPIVNSPLPLTRIVSITSFPIPRLRLHNSLVFPPPTAYLPAYLLIGLG